MNRILSAFALFFLCLTAWSVPTPEERIGHPVGADFKLARWETIVDYFVELGQLSDRILVEEVGRSTHDRPYIMATIASPDVLENLEEYKQLQRWMSHPNEIPAGQKDRVLTDAKSVVLVACSLHSTEIGASQMALELLYDFATRDDPAVKEILDNTIILLVPSANPDGIDRVIDWYERSLGTPWEGRGMPWLYQEYTGHDNNRDWFMVTQQETQILTRILYHEWYPGIVFDIHQMGNRGPRFIIPPYYDPLNPNLDPLINESLKIIGGHMATDLQYAGKSGVASNAIFDMWWHGGNRSTPYRHNIIGILSEAASVRIASPIFQERSELRGGGRGLPVYDPLVNHADPWPGGWWRLRDIIEYELVACESLFTLASRYRDRFNQNYMRMAENAISAGSTQPPYAYVIPEDQRDRPTAHRLLKVLHDGGVQIETADETFTLHGQEHPAGTPIIHLAQPYRNHILDLLEPQIYPERALYSGGPPEIPYDVAGWTLSYQMGVETIRADDPLQVSSTRLTDVVPPTTQISGTSSMWISPNQTTNDFILMNRCFVRGIRVDVITETGERWDKGNLLFLDSGGTVVQWAGSLGIELVPVTSSIPQNSREEIPAPRIGLYHPWTASMDEGWTRFVLEQFEFDYARVHNDDIRAGRLNARYDVILFPDLNASTIMNGMTEGTTEPQYVGGIGTLGVEHLQTFAREGGRLLFLDTSTRFAMDAFDLPVRNVLSGVSRDEFFCPGSVLRIKLDPSSWLNTGMPEYAAAFFARSYAFGIESTDNQTSLAATYDSTIPLLSGWIRGETVLANQGAIVSTRYGEGNIVLYGFRVQHRAQPHGVFRLMFNGLVMPNSIM